MHKRKIFQTYENVATYLLNQFAEKFGLTHVEGKQKVQGKPTNWEIDAKGCRQGSGGFIIIECRRYLKKKQNQEQIAALAYRIKDTGAGGAIVVSPLGFQSGAKRIAACENILEVMLTPDSSNEEYLMSFLNNVMAGFSDKVGV